MECIFKKEQVNTKEVKSDEEKRRKDVGKEKWEGKQKVEKGKEKIKRE